MTEEDVCHKSLILPEGWYYSAKFVREQLHCEPSAVQLLTKQGSRFHDLGNDAANSFARDNNSFASFFGGSGY